MSALKMVQCSCGREYNLNAMQRCPACRLEYRSLGSSGGSAVAAAPSVRTTPTPAFGVNTSSALAAAAAVAASTASGLTKITGIISGIGIAGGVLTFVVGIILLLDESSISIGIVLVAAGISGILIWILIAFVAQTLAAAVQLQAASARNSE